MSSLNVSGFTILNNNTTISSSLNVSGFTILGCRKRHALYQVVFLDSARLLYSDMLFDAQLVHFTTTTNMSIRSALRMPCLGQMLSYDKDMNELKKRDVFSVVDRPADRNSLGTTMVCKYKIDHVKNSVTRKCRLCLRGDWQKEGVDIFKYKTYSAVLITT